MDVRNIDEATERFEVLQTSERAQTALMTLAPGKATGRKAGVHEKSDQILLVLSGRVSGKVGQEKVSLKKGDVVLIRAGTPHRFKNDGKIPAVTFNVYAPPEYPPGRKG